MITKTFCFLPGIGAAKEERIKSVARDWNEFLQKDISFLPNKRICDFHIIQAREALRNKNSRYFTKILPDSEHWRLYNYFSDNVCYVDIETTGLSKHSNDITTISLWNGKETKTWVSGINLDEEDLAREVSKYDMVVTFNGKMFDLPFISNKFRSVVFDMPHADLRFVAKRAGYAGGLKKIEVALGLTRPEELQGVDGYMAVKLWQRWVRYKDKEALALLIKYNQEDVVNLEIMAKILCEKLKEEK